MKKSLYILIFFILNFHLFSQIPDGYYDSAEGLTGENLKSALNNIIDGHTELSYSALRDYVLKASDEDPDNSNNVILLYTGRSQSKSSFGGGANDWNREHVWAKSHGGFGNNPPPGTDAHHIRPTDASVNSARGSKDFDEGGTQHSEATECYYTSNTWEPRDEVKGDVARMMFYMAARYEGEGGEPDLELVDAVGTSGSQFGRLSTMLIWHIEDTVDDFESNRNEVVYSYQNNRNPFIDHPEYVNLIWGEAVLPPEFTSEPVTNAIVGSEYVYNITAEDTNPEAELVFSLESGPSWCVIENNNNWSANLSGTPTESDTGTYFVTISVTNGNSEVVNQSFTLLVIPSTITYFSHNEYFTIYPNPVFNELFIDYYFESNKYPSISLYNLKGNLIHTFQLSEYDIKNHQVRLNLNDKNIFSGVYFYKFEIDDFHLTGKLIFK